MADLLFTVTEKQTFSKKIKTLTKSDYNALADRRVLERGESYFNNGAVYPNITIELGNIEAEVAYTTVLPVFLCKSKPHSLLNYKNKHLYSKAK